jgi:hypothetical protein
MIRLVVLLQTLAQGPLTAPPGLVPAASNYSAPELQQFVAEAALGNRMIPRDLTDYRAKLETDIALIARTGPQEERAQQLEQVASDLSWDRRGRMEQRVVGYRDRALGLTISALTILKHPWVVPSLYGDRLRFALTPPTQPSTPGRPTKVLLAVHPLAADRDAIYDFSGGDTTMTMTTPTRTIHLVRVHVEPARAPGPRTMVFRGDLLIDAERKQLVRMRGEFSIAKAHLSPLEKIRETALQSLIFAELVNGEIQEQFWLPTYQRIEIQIRSRIATEVRPVFRLVTHFRDYDLGSGTMLGTPLDPSLPRETLTFASHDSLNAFSQWQRELGAEVTEVAATDFDDIAPDAWRPTGEPRLSVGAERPSQVLRFNRVEGLYFGPSLRFDLRDAAPGMSLTGHLGYAVAEQTVRGGVRANWLRGGWRLYGSAERALVNTNDFAPALEGDATVSALIATTDNFDYLDRWKATLGLARELGGPRSWRLNFETGPGYDRPEIARVPHGLFYGDSMFRANRPAAEGTYLREFLSLEFHPYVSGEYLEPGVGAALSYERGDGQLSWQRVEGRVVTRHTRGPFSFATRMDAGAVFGPLPPQQVIELGENEGLPGYAYKEFGGDRALLVRTAVVYTLPFLRAPLRPARWLVLPNLSPAIGAGLQGGWTSVSSAATWAALSAFGFRALSDPMAALVPATRPTNGFRSTVTLSLGLFGGSLAFGVARPLDHRAGWVFVIGTSQTL